MSRASEENVYDSIAEGFAARFADVPEDLVPLMEEIASTIDPTGLILDVGCGHGRDMTWFEQRRHRVVGFDLSKEMLKLAKGATVGRVAASDMQHLPVPDHCADAVWCNAALLHLPKSAAPAAIGEFHRVLRPDGLLMISVQQGDHDGPRHNDAWNVSRHFSDYQAQEVRSLLTMNGFAVTRQTASRLPAVTWIQTVGVRLR